MGGVSACQTQTLCGHLAIFLLLEYVFQRLEEDPSYADHLLYILERLRHNQPLRRETVTMLQDGSMEDRLKRKREENEWSKLTRYTKDLPVRFHS